jgi:MFS family permease
MLTPMKRMKLNVGLLAMCQALMMTANVLLITTSALVGQRLAALQAMPEYLATLPLALQFLATMFTTIPASLLMKQTGRRAGFLIGSALGLAGAALACYAIVHDSFTLFALSMLLFGAHNGFGTYYRFAAADSATPDYRATAISYVMAGGVVAALLGPNLASWTRAWLAAAPFAGSYLAVTGLYCVSLVTLMFIRLPQQDDWTRRHSGRPLREIAAQQTFIVAVLAAMLGYGVMSLVMTATPLAMHAHAHDFSTTAFVIEWHVLGMFAPSFFTGHLIRRFGVANIMLTGALLYIFTVAINLAGSSANHFWMALFFLGVGWNFLFVGGTTLLTETYDEQEKAKVQALNDFLVFTTVTVASLSAGVLQHQFGWRVVNLGVLPLIVMILAAVIWLKLTHCCEPVKVAVVESEEI